MSRHDQLAQWAHSRARVQRSEAPLTYWQRYRAGRREREAAAQREELEAAGQLSLNLHRRHLDESQRALVAAKIANMRQGARTDLTPIGGTSQDEAAELLNVGVRSVQRAREVLDHGAPELVAAVEQGSGLIAQNCAVTQGEAAATITTAQKKAEVFD